MNYDDLGEFEIIVDDQLYKVTIHELEILPPNVAVHTHYPLVHYTTEVYDYDTEQWVPTGPPEEVQNEVYRFVEQLLLDARRDAELRSED